ncbi:hypothetical protein [Dyella sp. ASV21]|nr:hypothetical protein [Dyella sp. ASV21]
MERKKRDSRSPASLIAAVDAVLGSGCLLYTSDAADDNVRV